MIILYYVALRMNLTNFIRNLDISKLYLVLHWSSRKKVCFPPWTIKIVFHTMGNIMYWCWFIDRVVGVLLVGIHIISWVIWVTFLYYVLQCLCITMPSYFDIDLVHWAVSNFFECFFDLVSGPSLEVLLSVVNEFDDIAFTLIVCPWRWVIEHVRLRKPHKSSVFWRDEYLHQWLHVSHCIQLNGKCGIAYNIDHIQLSYQLVFSNFVNTMVPVLSFLPDALFSSTKHAK